VGGWLTDHFNWRWIFYINLPVGMLALAVIASALPRLRHDSSARKIDYAGSVSIAAGLIALLLALVWGGHEYPWRSLQIIGLFAASGVSLAAFGVIEAAAADPILPLECFANAAFSASMAATFLTSVAMFGALAFLPLYAQSVVGYSATNSGLVLAPMMGGLIFASAIAGQIITRTGKYKTLAVIGMAAAALGMFLFSKLKIDTTVGSLIRDMIVLGAGLGLTFPIFTIVVQSAFPHSKLGVVTASNQLFRSIGGTVGIAVMGGLLNNGLADRLTDVQAMPFVQVVNRMNPDRPLEAVTTNTLQNFLSAAGQQRIDASISKAPPGMQTKLRADHTEFIGALKQAFAGSIGRVFLGSSYLMCLAFGVTLLLPVIPLRRTHKATVPEEIGKELDAEFGQAEPKDEPELD
jgi:predicted MFS family arabinose efflux permease